MNDGIISRPIYYANIEVFEIKKRMYHLELLHMKNTNSVKHALIEAEAACRRPASYCESDKSMAANGSHVPFALAVALGFNGSGLVEGVRRTAKIASECLLDGTLSRSDEDTSRLATGFANLRILEHLDESACLEIAESLVDLPGRASVELALLISAMFGVHRDVPWRDCRAAIDRLLVPLITTFIERGNKTGAFWCAITAYSAMRPVPDRAEQIVPITRRIEGALAPLYVEISAQNPRTLPIMKKHVQTIGFVLVSDHFLGHAENLLGMLIGLSALESVQFLPVVYILDEVSGDRCLVDQLRTLRIPHHIISQRFRGASSPPSLAQLPRLLKRAFREDDIDIAVWVAVPHFMPFAFSLGLASTQIWWSMKFKHDAYPMADGYFYTRSLVPRRETVGTTIWNIGPKALPSAAGTPAAEPVAALRRRFAHWDLILGVVARGEKIADLPYLEAVATLLDRHPNAGFLWTGRSENSVVVDFFRSRGLAERQCFIGWVDPAVTVRVFDIYLDTFTLSGITTIRALAAGTPVVEFSGAQGPLASLLDPGLDPEATYVGSPNKLHQLVGDLGSFGPPFAASTAQEYVDRADRLICDRALRYSYGQTCRRFALDRLVDPRHAAASFTESVMDIVHRQHTPGLALKASS